MKITTGEVGTNEVVDAFDYLEYSSYYEERRRDIILSALAVNYNLKSTLVNWLGGRSLDYCSVRQSQSSDKIYAEVSKLYCEKFNLQWQVEAEDAHDGVPVLTFRGADGQPLHADAVVSGYSGSQQVQYKCPCTLKEGDVVRLSAAEVVVRAPRGDDSNSETSSSASGSISSTAAGATSRGASRSSPDWWQIDAIHPTRTPLPSTPVEEEGASADIPLATVPLTLRNLRTGERRHLSDAGALLGALVRKTVPLSSGDKSRSSGASDGRKCLDDGGEGGGDKQTPSEGGRLYCTSVAFQLPAPDPRGALAIFRANMKACVAISNRMASRSSPYVLHQCKAWLTGRERGNYAKRLFQQHYRDYQYCVSSSSAGVVQTRDGRQYWCGEEEAAARLQSSLCRYYSFERWRRVGLLLKCISEASRSDHVSSTPSPGGGLEKVDVFFALWWQWSVFFDGVVHQFFAEDCGRFWHSRLRCAYTNADHPLLARARAFKAAHAATTAAGAAVAPASAACRVDSAGAPLPPALQLHPFGRGSADAVHDMVAEVLLAAERSALTRTELRIMGFACDGVPNAWDEPEADGDDPETKPRVGGSCVVQGLRKAYSCSSLGTVVGARCSNRTLEAVSMPATLVAGDIIGLPLSPAYLLEHHPHETQEPGGISARWAGATGGAACSKSSRRVGGGAAASSGSGGGVAGPVFYYEVVGVDVLAACLKLTPLEIDPCPATTLHQILTHRAALRPLERQRQSCGAEVLRVTPHCLWKAVVYRVCPQVSLICDANGPEDVAAQGAAKHVINYALFQLPIPDPQAVLRLLVQELELTPAVLGYS